MIELIDRPSVIIQANGEGSYHEQAAHIALGEQAQLVNVPTFDEGFDRFYYEGEGDFAVFAVANSIARVEERIGRIVDASTNGSLHILKKVKLPVRHRLIGIDPDVSLEDITYVHSQEPALLQCRNYLKTTLPRARTVKQVDTAWSVQHIIELNDPLQVAIASKKTLETYPDAVILDGDENDRGIQDHPQNETHFWVLGRQPQYEADATSTIVRLRTNDRPGSLVLPLVALSVNGINMTDLDKIYSLHSSPEFLVEFEGGMHEPRVRQAIEEMGKFADEVLILGSVNPLTPTTC